MITGLDFALLAMTDVERAADEFFALLLRVTAEPSGPGDADRLAWMSIGTLFRLRDMQPDDPIAAELFRELAPKVARRLREDGYLDGLHALIDVYRATLALAPGAVGRPGGALRDLVRVVDAADARVRALLAAMCGTLVTATDENFEVRAYLSANLQLKQISDEHGGFDVAEHFDHHGRAEGRKLKVFGAMPAFRAAEACASPVDDRLGRIRARAAKWFAGRPSERHSAEP